MKILIYGLNYAPELTGTANTRQRWRRRWPNAATRFVSSARRLTIRSGRWRGYRVAASRRGPRRCAHLARAAVGAEAPNGLKRMLHLASFAARSLPALAAHLLWRPHVVMTDRADHANAPAALALARSRGARTWLHIQDFEVDAAFDLGLLKSERARQHGALRSKAACCGASTSCRRSPTRWSIARCRQGRRAFERVSLAELGRYDGDLSARPRERIPSRAGHRPSIRWSCSIRATWARSRASKCSPMRRRVDGRREDIVFVFCGNGATKARVCKALRDLAELRASCRLQPVERLNELLNLADIHVLPQRGDVADLVMPSKLTGMFAVRGR